MSRVASKKHESDRSKHDYEDHNDLTSNLLRDNDFESMSAENILNWATNNFKTDRVVLSTSFQYSGVAMIDMISRFGLSMRIATVDTWRLHEETYGYIRKLEQHYDIKIEIHQPNPEQIDSMVDRFGEYLFFDSKAKQEYCCQVRKVRPHRKLLKTADCWISGVRRDQTSRRADNTPKASLVPEYGTQRQVLKFNPLADWTEDQLSKFIEKNEILDHPLYARGYRSIGCFICSTTAVAGEDQRAGRWRWFNEKNRQQEEDAKECGLHYNI